MSLNSQPSQSNQQPDPILSSAARTSFAHALLPGPAAGIDNDVLFTCAYDIPRGKESMPLMSILEPLYRLVFRPWAPEPFETLTLPQILYRCVGSVREPARRIRLVLPHDDSARTTFDRLLRELARQARANLGAALLPIPISVSRLLEHVDELQRRAKEIQDASTEAGPLILDACRWILMIAARIQATPEVVADLCDALREGNAWLLFEDDADPGASFRSVQKLLDLVLGDGELSHLPVLLVTSCKDHMIVKDMKPFTLMKHAAAAATPTPSVSITLAQADWLRKLSVGGTPPLRLQLIGVLTTMPIVLYIIYLFYNKLILDANSGYWWWIVGAGVFVAFHFFPLAVFLGCLAYGSEEVRRSVRDILAIFIPAILFSMLLYLPTQVSPGLWRTACIIGAGLIPSFFWGYSLIAVLSLLSNVMWLYHSDRLLRSLDIANWQQLTQYLQVNLYPASHDIALPIGPSTAPILPLLVSDSTKEVIPMLLETFPDLVSTVRQTIVNGLKKEGYKLDYTVSALLLSA